MSRGKLRLIGEMACDGIPRFEVRGSAMAFKVPYSIAYGEVFRLAGGTIEPGMAADSKPTRVFTPQAIKRITALNHLYRPFAIKHHAAQVVAADLLRQQNQAEVAKASTPDTVAPWDDPNHGEDWKK